MKRVRLLSAWSAAILVAAAWLGGCSAPRPAPVEERKAVGKPSTAPAAGAPAPAAARGVPEQTYVVKPGDTLYKIAVDHSLDYRDLIRWNNLDDSALIKVGQTLRLSGPEGAATASVAETVPVKTGSIESRPLTTPPVEAPKPVAKAEPAPADEPDAVGWIWPATGKVIGTFGDGKSKGINISGKMGEPVVAAADGKVEYAGNGLRGYGNLIVVKHNDSYLSAYAHNRINLVSEGQRVRRGQKIAEMGNSDSDQVKLHFEIRRQGKPVDPLKFLPER